MKKLLLVLFVVLILVSCLIAWAHTEFWDVQNETVVVEPLVQEFSGWEADTACPSACPCP